MLLQRVCARACVVCICVCQSVSQLVCCWPACQRGESRALLGTTWCSIFQDVVAGTEAVANRRETKAGE